MYRRQIDKCNSCVRHLILNQLTHYRIFIRYRRNRPNSKRLSIISTSEHRWSFRNKHWNHLSATDALKSIVIHSKLNILKKCLIRLSNVTQTTFHASLATMSLKFIPNKSELVQVMAWHGTGNKPRTNNDAISWANVDLDTTLLNLVRAYGWVGGGVIKNVNNVNCLEFVWCEMCK